MSTPTVLEFDAEKDADALGAPLAKWARLGFMRGFSGIRKEVLPEGAMTLPSKAFGEAAASSMSVIGLPEGERTRREAYVEDVQERLRVLQNGYIQAHYRNSLWGHVADFVMALLIVALTVTLLWEFGVFSHYALFLVFLLAAKTIFLRVSVIRAFKIAQTAFKTNPASIVLPWDADKRSV